jgi:ribosomal protein S18 acetylase RimI-like enzyme
VRDFHHRDARHLPKQELNRNVLSEPVPSKAGVAPELRAAGPEDEDFRFDVFVSWRRQEYASAGCGDSQLELLLRLQFRSQQREYAVRFPDSRPSIILVGGRPAGTLWVSRSEQEYRIVEIAILPEFRNRKIGAAILKDLLEEAARNGKPVVASVGKSNSGSIRFHSNLGFKIRSDDGVYLRMEFQPGSVPR